MTPVHSTSNSVKSVYEKTEYYTHKAPPVESRRVTKKLSWSHITRSEGVLLTDTMAWEAHVSHSHVGANLGSGILVPPSRTVIVTAQL